ncbi:MAG: hypothetical protein AAF399_12005 [Bacteroidota bacterium]
MQRSMPPQHLGLRVQPAFVVMAPPIIMIPILSSSMIPQMSQ